MITKEQKHETKNKHILKFTFNLFSKLLYDWQAVTLTVLSKQVEIFVYASIRLACVLVHILVAVVLVTNRICLIYENIIHMFVKLQN